MGAMEPGTGIARGARILVVEDDPAINGVVCSYLGKAGAVCSAAFSGTEALLLMDASPAFDLVVTDLMLPGMTGEDIVGAIRRADAIVVLDEGRVAGLGTHDELMERCGEYREIALSQLSAEELAGGDAA